jgi:hypothetical protein
MPPAWIDIVSTATFVSGLSTLVSTGVFVSGLAQVRLASSLPVLCETKHNPNLS